MAAVVRFGALGVEASATGRVVGGTELAGRLVEGPVMAVWEVAAPVVRAVGGAPAGSVLGAVVGPARGALAAVAAGAVLAGSVAAEGWAIAVLLASGAEPPHAPSNAVRASSTKTALTRIL